MNRSDVFRAVDDMVSDTNSFYLIGLYPEPFARDGKFHDIEDAPALDCAYKLQEYAGQPRRKRSEGKATWPGRKQVYRSYD